MRLRKERMQWAKQEPAREQWLLSPAWAAARALRRTRNAAAVCHHRQASSEKRFSFLR